MILIIRLAGIIAIFWTLTACQSITNYNQTEGPLFTGTYTNTPAEVPAEIKIITWNIKFSEHIDTAIAELSKVKELQHADIILLQEMDETGVEAIARALQYNYVYYPASIHSHHDKNFGNTILSKWPLSDPVKLQLPHENPKNKQTRIATRAVVTIGDKQIPVYSVHTETLWLSGSKRSEQLDTLTTDIGENTPYVIIGGDFNTLTDDGAESLTERFAQAKLERVSAGAEPTFSAGGIEFTSDHIFSRGMAPIENGVWPDTQASDHFPVWVILANHR
jgi:endonuclease/exonuclease/phosphatase family metal-dependent hydrolase